MEIDHLIYGAPDLETGTREIEALLGVRPAPGGKHVGIGTHNALLGLGAGVYLEVIALDPDQHERLRPLPYGLDAISKPRLITWAVRTPDIDERTRRARAASVDLGAVQAMSRERPDGTRLEWQLTRSSRLVGDGLIPFLIQWAPGLHPSETSPAGCRFVSLRGEHPEPDRITRMLEAMGVVLPVTAGIEPALVVTIEGRNGIVKLR
jgi:hypothetical protein